MSRKLNNNCELCSSDAHIHPESANSREMDLGTLLDILTSRGARRCVYNCEWDRSLDRSPCFIAYTLRFNCLAVVDAMRRFWEKKRDDDDDDET